VWLTHQLVRTDNNKKSVIGSNAWLSCSNSEARHEGQQLKQERIVMKGNQDFGLTEKEWLRLVKKTKNPDKYFFE